MPKIFIVFFLFSCSAPVSKKVLVSGFVSSKNKGRHTVNVVLNDTLRKFDFKKNRYENFSKLIRDTNHSVWSKDDGGFKIRGKKGDSLYFYLEHHFTKAYKIANLLKMKTVDIKLEPEICIPYVPCNDTVPSRSFVFIGERIKVQYEKEPYYCDYYISMDNLYKAEYKILQQVQGNVPKDTLTFTVFDHYGTPGFSLYQNVLLYVSEYCGKLYHKKYYYFALFKTANGRWAIPRDPYNFIQLKRKDLRIQPIQFADSVWFDINEQRPKFRYEQYSAPYFKIEGEKAIPIMGTYLEDLPLDK
ncbi:MAG TPA: hypothetical protein VF602_05070 [Pedobacter sp.]